jgi:nickel transport protein
MTLLLSLALLLIMTSIAQAHRVRLFASVEGDVITGHAYFGSGAHIADATVTIAAPDGTRLAAVTTSDVGTFRFTPTMRCDHVLTLRLSDGHAATWTIPADELPADLPTPPSPQHGEPPAHIHASHTDPVAHDHAEHSHPPMESVGRTDLEPIVRAVVRDEVSRQIHPVREQIDRYEATVRWRDVLGGIGYILGLAGLAALILSRRSS